MTQQNSLPPQNVPFTDKSGLVTLGWHGFLTSLCRQQFFPIDTTAGEVDITLGDPRQNLNVEWIYKKTSSDGNHVVITGAGDGVQTLSSQYAKVRFKSDGTNWWVV